MSVYTDSAFAPQGLRWTRAPVQQHMFNRLRLAARPHLVSLAGGTAHLPITDPAARWLQPSHAATHAGNCQRTPAGVAVCTNVD